MCFGGGNASQAATQQQEQQNAEVSSNIAGINSAFANRQGQYNDYLNALNKSYQTQLNYQQASASRGLKFALARGGMTGSSVAADQGAELQREMGQAQVTSEEQAQAKLAGLQSSDLASKQQMISLAESGANIGNAAQQTATALQSNIQGAQTNLGPNTLGQMFGGITNTVNNMNTAASTRMGLRAAQAYTNPFSNSAATNSGYFNG
jgi:hypothetical protein